MMKAGSSWLSDRKLGEVGENGVSWSKPEYIELPVVSRRRLKAD